VEVVGPLVVETPLDLDDTLVLLLGVKPLVVVPLFFDVVPSDTVAVEVVTPLVVVPLVFDVVPSDTVADEVVTPLVVERPLDVDDKIVLLLGVIPLVVVALFFDVVPSDTVPEEVVTPLVVERPLDVDDTLVLLLGVIPLVDVPVFFDVVPSDIVVLCLLLPLELVETPSKQPTMSNVTPFTGCEFIDITVITTDAALTPSFISTRVPELTGLSVKYKTSLLAFRRTTL
jgi:hypothetical protein